MMQEERKNQKEKFLAIQTYEEYYKRIEEFKGIDVKDREIREHHKKLYEKAPKKEYYTGELYTVFPDGSRMIGGPGMIAVKEKGYKSVEDYERRSHEEWLKKQEQEQS